MVSARYTGPRLRRDGTVYKLQVRLQFDGAAGFTTTVFLDGRKVMSGAYSPPSDAKYFKSKRYYMKHGVYSRHMWAYEFTSNDVTVMRQKP